MYLILMHARAALKLLREHAPGAAETQLLELIRLIQEELQGVTTALGEELAMTTMHDTLHMIRR